VEIKVRIGPVLLTINIITIQTMPEAMELDLTLDLK
jgi:hypothetical protein